MKKVLLLFVIMFLFFSCQKEKEFNEIICHVENAEGIELVFSTKGEDFKDRQIQKVKNGKVVFKSYNKTTEISYIESAYNLDKYNNQRRWLRILPEKNDINIGFKIIKDSTEVDTQVFSLIYNFEEIKFKNNGRNKKYHEFVTKLLDITKGNYYTNSIMDSLNLYVFPDQKRKMLNLYSKEINNSLDETLQIEFLTSMLVHRWPFGSNDYITKQEKKKINTFFKKINIKPDTDNYIKLQDKINQINNLKDKEIKFSNFTFKDINQQKTTLLELVERNKFTVLYFWTESCGPCRIFNEKLKSKNKALNDNGIEIVHISVDLQEKFWKRATKEDAITWTNLYAGKNLKLHREYNIRWWPTKIIFNTKKELINFDFINPEDLLALTK